MLSRIRTILYCGISAMIISSCTSSGGETAALDLDKIRPEIQAMEDAYAAGEKAKDAAAVVAYYSDDAVTYGRNEEPTSGKAAIQERVARRLASDTTGNTNVYKVVDLFGAGDLLVEIGSWTEMTPGGEEAGKGHYLSVFEKRDGKYVCIRDMSVKSSPETPPM